jgi:hypothetical protein
MSQAEYLAQSTPSGDLTRWTRRLIEEEPQLGQEGLKDDDDKKMKGVKQCEVGIKVRTPSFPQHQGHSSPVANSDHAKLG